MNCPKCGATMETGAVYSDRYLYWTPELTKIRNFHVPKDAFRLRPEGDHTRSALSPKALNSIPQYAAALCRACGTAMFSFETDK